MTYYKREYEKFLFWIKSLMNRPENVITVLRHLPRLKSSQASLLVIFVVFVVAAEALTLLSHQLLLRLLLLLWSILQFYCSRYLCRYTFSDYDWTRLDVDRSRDDYLSRTTGGDDSWLRHDGTRHFVDIKH